MAHFPKPFFRPKKKRWYVQLDGKHVNLGSDKDDAFRRYHVLMTEREKGPVVSVGDSAPVVAVLDLFLEWCEGHKARRTYDWYLAYLQSFVKTLPPLLKVADLRPFHVQEWLDKHPGWKTGRRGAIIAVQRALNWAVKQGRIDTNPVKYMEKPPQGRREKLVSPEEYAEVLALVKDQEFRDLLELSWVRPDSAS